MLQCVYTCMKLKCWKCFTCVDVCWVRKGWVYELGRRVKCFHRFNFKWLNARNFISSCVWFVAKTFSGNVKIMRLIFQNISCKCSFLEETFSNIVYACICVSIVIFNIQRMCGSLLKNLILLQRLICFYDLSTISGLFKTETFFL